MTLILFSPIWCQSIEKGRFQSGQKWKCNKRISKTSCKFYSYCFIFCKGTNKQIIIPNSDRFISIKYETYCVYCLLFTIFVTCHKFGHVAEKKETPYPWEYPLKSVRLLLITMFADYKILSQPVAVVWYIFRLLLTTCLKQTCTMLQFDNCHCGFLV